MIQILITVDCKPGYHGRPNIRISTTIVSVSGSNNVTLLLHTYTNKYWHTHVWVGGIACAQHLCFSPYLRLLSGRNWLKLRTKFDCKTWQESSVFNGGWCYRVKFPTRDCTAISFQDSGFFRCLRIAWRLGRIAYARTLWKLLRGPKRNCRQRPE